MRYVNFYKLLTLVLLLMACNSCVSSKRPASDLSRHQKAEQEKTYAIKGVNIIPMTTDSTIIENATVVIKNKKILSIGHAAPENITAIDGRGKWLIPGLIDMHVHNLADINFSATWPTKGATLFVDAQDLMLLYMANGVTTVFELSARAEHFGQRNDIIKGKVIGPRIALAYLIDGGNGAGNIANTPSDGRQTVRIAKAQGYEFIKVYSSLNIETFHGIIDEANKQNMKVVGHIPNAFKGKPEEAFVPGFSMVAHAEEFAKQTDDFSDRDAKRFAQLAKQNGTWLTPTLTTMEWIASQARSLDGVRNLSSLKYVHPLMQSKWLTSNNYNNGTSADRVARFEKMIEFHIRLIKAFKELDVPIVAGTDAGVSGVVWGFSLQDEIELLVKAGLTPAEALASATRLPATWLGIADKTGTVEVGKYADLILLEANPLEKIQNTQKIAGVFANGEWLSKDKLEKMMADLAKRNRDNLDKYDWKKRKD